MSYKRGVQDATLLLLAGATLTATGNGAALDLGEGFAPEGGRAVQAPIDVTAIDRTTGDETYKFKLQDSPDDATYTDRSPDVSTTVVGTIYVQGVIHNRYVRLVRTLAGTTPSVTIGNVYLDPTTFGAR